MKRLSKRLFILIIISVLMVPLNMKNVDASGSAAVIFYKKNATKDASDRYSLRQGGYDRYFYNSGATSETGDENANAHFDFETNVLTLNNYDFGSITFADFKSENQKHIKIVLKGDNTIDMSPNRVFETTIRGIFVETQANGAVLEFTTLGSQPGSLTINSSDQTDVTRLINTDNTSVKITNNANLVLNANPTVYSPGRHTMVYILDGNLELLDHTSLKIDASLSKNNYEGIKLFNENKFILNTDGHFTQDFTDRSGATTGAAIYANVDLQKVKTFKSKTTSLAYSSAGNFVVNEEAFHKVHIPMNPPENRYEVLEYYMKSHFNDAESIVVSDETLELKVKEEKQLSAHVLPPDAFNTDVSWSVDNEEILSVTQTGVVSALKEGTANVIVSAKFNPTVTKSIPVTITPAENDKYYVEVIDGTGDGYYEEGDIVTIEANEAHVRYVFEKWQAPSSVTLDIYDSKTTFIMPKEDVVITAKYELKQISNIEWSGGTQITFDAFPEAIKYMAQLADENGNRLSSGWRSLEKSESEGRVTVDIKNLLMSNGILGSHNYTVRLVVWDAGNTALSKQAITPKPKEITLGQMATPTNLWWDGYEVNWSLVDGATHYDLELWRISKGVTKKVSSLSQRNGPTESFGTDNYNEDGLYYFKVIALGDADQLLLKSEPGISPYKQIGNNPYKVTIQNGTGGGIYQVGDEVEIKAEDRVGYNFVSWDSEDVELSDNPNTSFIMPDKDVTITAVYEEIKVVTYDVTVINGTGGGTYEVGDEVVITAENRVGYNFVSWSSDDVELLDNPHTSFIMPDKDVTITAVYEEIKVVTYDVTVINGTGGGTYEAGDEVVITAEDRVGYNFVSWSSDDVELLDTPHTSFIMPNKDVTVTAIYEEVKSYTYEILEGANPSWTLGQEGVVFLKVDANHLDVVELLMDGEVIDPSHYTLKEGSAVIELFASYLNTLEEGVHHFAIIFEHMALSTDFTVLAKTVDPVDPVEPVEPEVDENLPPNEDIEETPMPKDEKEEVVKDEPEKKPLPNEVTKPKKEKNDSPEVVEKDEKLPVTGVVNMLTFASLLIGFALILRLKNRRRKDI